MKLVVYNVSNKKRSLRGKININVEKILVTSFITTFIILIIAQIMMINPSVRTFTNTNAEIEGRRLGLEEFLYDKGTLVFEQKGDRLFDDVNILVNGEQVAAFISEKISIEVKDGDVVEIDGSLVNDDVFVEITSKSSNIISGYIGEKMNVKRQVVEIIKIKME